MLNNDLCIGTNRVFQSEGKGLRASDKTLIRQRFSTVSKVLFVSNLLRNLLVSCRGVQPYYTPCHMGLDRTPRLYAPCME